MKTPESAKSADQKSFEFQSIKLILTAALLISVPVYLLLLLIFDDPLLTGEKKTVSRAAVNNKQGPPVHRTGELDFAPQNINTIDSEKKFLESLLFTLEMREGLLPKKIYLRTSALELFTERSMTTRNNVSICRGWPDFAFNEDNDLNSRQQNRYYLDFFVSYEARLPHYPMVHRLAGPVRFSSMHDGSLILEKTIMAGDQFEIWSMNSPELHPADEPAAVEPESPYLDLKNIETNQIQRITQKICENTVATTAKILLMQEFLEKNGTYMTEARYEQGPHPVNAFLEKGMYGHCQHFAAALAAMLRTQKIPARVAKGYASNMKKDRTFFIASGMGHAWVEILCRTGWKIVDPAPVNTMSPPLLAKNLALPDSQTLEVIRQNRVNNIMATTENLDEMRHENDMARNIELDNPEKSGTVIEDREKTKQATAADQKKELKKHEQKQKDEKRRRRTSTIALLLLISLIYLTGKKADKLLLLLLSLSGKKKNNTIEQIEAETSMQKLVTLLDKTDRQIVGTTLATMFGSFSRFTSNHGTYQRHEAETPAEYFSRLAKELGIDQNSAKKMAGLLQAEIYGQQNCSSAEQQKFAEFLRQLLQGIVS
jgi:hypothetical protein